MGVVILLAIFLFSINATNSSLPYGKIIFVDDNFTNEPSNHKWNTIQAAIDDAEDGDIVFVFEGTYNENIFVDKRIALIGESTDNVIIDGNSRLYTVNLLANGIVMENFTIRGGLEAGIYTEYENITIKNCKITNNELFGIEIASNNVTVVNCTIFNLEWGMMIHDSSNCTIKDFEIYDIENKSITILSSKNISIENATIYDSFCGIWLLNTTNSSIYFSNISNNIVGITVENSSGNEIVNSYFTDNFGYGIYLKQADENEIVNSYFTDNFGYGIFSENSYNNTIHHNNFIGNGIHAYDTGMNKWNSSIGNYWEGYVGTDTDENGIIDNEYVIGASADYKPLLYPIESPPFFAWVDDDYNSSTPGWNMDHFNSLQEAINAVKDGGKCYVYYGLYSGCKIGKSLDLIGENAYIFSNGDGIFVTADNVNIKGFYINAEDNGIKIQNAENVNISKCNAMNSIFGLYAVNSRYCKINDSIFYENVKGIYLFNSSKLVISNSFIHNNTYFGIEMGHSSSDNLVYDCQIENNGNYGIYIVQNSNDNKIYHNNFVDNTAYDSCDNEWGSLYEYAIGNYWDDYNGIDKNRDGMGDTPYFIEGGEIDSHPLMNPIADPPFFVWVNNEYNSSFPGWMLDHFSTISSAVNRVMENGGCFVFPGVYTDNVEIDKEMIISGAGKEETIVSGNGKSAFVVNGSNVKVYSFGVKNCWNDAGIAVFANNVEINDCNCFDNYYGIYINAINTTVEKSNIFDNSFVGVLIEYSQHASIKNCSISGNNNGMMIGYSYYSNVEGNKFLNNSVNALKISHSYYTIMHHNVFERNLYGAYVEASSNILFYLNDFIDNDMHAYDDGANSWNNGNTGNYWDDYTGTDGNEDGIGDTPYKIDSNSIDWYPLIKRAGFPVVYFSFTPSTPFTYENVNFTDNSVDLDGYIVSWLWDFGDGKTSNEQNPTHFYEDNGIYTVNLTVIDNDGNKGSIEKQIVVLNTPPAADFSWQPSEPTDIEDVIFNASLSYDIDGYIVNYTWDFGDGNISYGQNVSHRYAENGNYTVKLTIIDDDGAVTWITKEVVVLNVPPVANFSYTPEEVSTYETIFFSQSSYDLDGYIVSWLWDFGDGKTSNEQNPTHFYEDNGIYTVNLTVIDNDGNKGSIEKQIVVLNTPPAADFSWQPSEPTDIEDVIFNASLSYDIDGYIVSYAWDFESDGIIDEYGINTMHIYQDNGKYNVTLIITDDDGATDSVTKMITILNVPPTPSFSYTPEEPTDLEIVEFTDSSIDLDGSIINWTWDFGDGNVSYEKNPKHQYRNNGVYSVSLTLTDNDGAKRTTSKAILIRNVPPVANFSWQPSEPTDLQKIVFNASLSYDEDGSIVNYTWDFGNGNVSYGESVTYKYKVDGIYTVTLTVKDDDGAKTEISKQVEVKNVKPEAMFTYKPSKPREDEMITFNASSSYDPDGDIMKYSWDFDGDGVIDAYGMEVTHKYSKKRDYRVILTVEDDDGAKDLYDLVITVREKERVPGFELSIIVIASAILIFMRRYKKGIWRM